MILPEQAVRIAPGTRLHFLGIGGIGMSGLASIYQERGCQISGCDAKVNASAHRLRQRGAIISAGHHPAHLHEGAQVVVYSSAVAAEEPELVEARARGLRTISRGELLAALAMEHRLIGVAGAHGKTTTSGMASQLLIHAGWDPTVVVGGIMLSLGANARNGTGAYLVAETDESDGSFLHLFPHIAIITNIDREHLNHYQSFDTLIAAFQQYALQLRAGGALICCADDPIIRETLSYPSQLTYGFSCGADVTAERIRFLAHSSAFRASFKGRALGAFTLSVPGRHNVLNALAVIALGLTLDLPMLTVREALAGFQGTRRRFQLRRLPGDIWFVEDYAHHPSEIQATLDADAINGRHRLVVFQPHRFSRTQALEREFSSCFDRADGVIITDIYPAFETPIPGISGERLATLVRDRGHPHVRYVPKQELSSFVQRIARPGDTIFFLGAGDIGDLCHAVATQMRSSA
ncbi:MAG: UDP-N-acetylmuramate--L-alanine ligase [Candidatus Omnitrophica bacterium]|nr:UDP-N-acetylmuramate--L-alanine ligase [Candidatus Omnitrophota bacterium]